MLYFFCTLIHCYCYNCVSLVYHYLHIHRISKWNEKNVAFCMFEKCKQYPVIGKILCYTWEIDYYIVYILKFSTC